MAKKGNRLRSFEKNNRTLDISSAQEERQKKRKSGKGKKIKTQQKSAVLSAVPADGAEGAENAGGRSSEQRGGLAAGKKRLNLFRLAGFALSLIFIIIVGMSVKNIYDLKEREQALMDRHEELLHMKEELTLQLENVNSDEYIEEQARRELKLIKGNELIFYFTEDDGRDD